MPAATTTRTTTRPAAALSTVFMTNSTLGRQEEKRIATLGCAGTIIGVRAPESMESFMRAPPAASHRLAALARFRVIPTRSLEGHHGKAHIPRTLDLHPGDRRRNQAGH